MLITVTDVYGERHRVKEDDLASGKRTLVRRYNQFKRPISGAFASSQVHRGNIVGPWPGCVHDLDAHKQKMDALLRRMTTDEKAPTDCTR